MPVKFAVAPRRLGRRLALARAAGQLSRGAVRSFIETVADSNLGKMAGLWGTAKGPAARTRVPPDYERRIVVIQSYLRHDGYRIVADAPESDARHGVQAELRREACSWLVRFTTIKLGDGSWIVNQVDLTAAGNPARSCDPGVSDSAGGK